jgi:hypothetical protein
MVTPRRSSFPISAIYDTREEYEEISGTVIDWAVMIVRIKQKPTL